MKLYMSTLELVGGLMSEVSSVITRLSFFQLTKRLVVGGDIMIGESENSKRMGLWSEESILRLEIREIKVVRTRHVKDVRFI